jgi:hypothetical protein
MFQENTNVDIDMWPILIVRADDNDNADISNRTLAVIEQMYQIKKEPYVTILDARNGRRPSAPQRYVETEFRRKHEDHIKEYSRGTAIVLKSEILKAVVTAVHLIKPPATTTKFFTDMQRAFEWARTQLEE